MYDRMPEVHAELMDILRALEAHYKDMQDTEFTVEEGQLYMLQTRNAKRPAQAALRFAVDAVASCSAEPGAMTIDPGALDVLLHATFDPLASSRCSRPGSTLPRRGQARSCSPPPTPWRPPRRAHVLLVRPFTDAEDVAGFHAARGFLTSEGGKASHRRLWPAGWAGPPWSAPRRWRSTPPPER